MISFSSNDGRRILSLLLCVLCASVANGSSTSAAPSIALDHDFLTAYDLFLKRYGTGPVVDVREASTNGQAWATFPYPTDLYPGPRPAPAGDLAWNEALYRRALSQYERALDAVNAFREREQELKDERENLREALWWKQIDAVDRIERVEQRVRDRYHRETAQYFRGTFESLDRIDRESLDSSERVVELRKRAYRLYAVHEIALGGFTPALKVLERYQDLPGDPSVREEWPLHYYLSMCYAAQFRRGRANTGVSEVTLRALRRRKNIHKLRAVELRHGRNSEEFRRVFADVRLEELGSPRSD